VLPNRDAPFIFPAKMNGAPVQFLQSGLEHKHAHKPIINAFYIAVFINRDAITIL